MFNTEEYIYQDGDFIWVSVAAGYNQIEDMLIGKGVPQDRIICQGKVDSQLCHEQYFDSELINPFERDTVFVDCGCFDGSDSIKFIEHCKDRKRAKIYAFEPNGTNYEICKKRLSEYPNVKLFNMAVGDENRAARISNEDSCSKIDHCNGEPVQIVRIDDMMGNRKVDYIKMDLEGYEEKALLGAENIIKRQKPMLAISIYHKRWDIFRIPALILSLNSDYKFYLRHYGSLVSETILYAF